jgi:ribose-phosphate pyrophosphokinase
MYVHFGIMAKNRFFITPEQYIEKQSEELESTEGKLLIAALDSGKQLADSVVGVYRDNLHYMKSSGNLVYLEGIEKRFSDGEGCIELDKNVRGSDVFLIQSLHDPVSGRTVNENYFAFLIALRTFRENGAKTITAVLPYLAYARQDKPTKFRREPTTARLLADLSVCAGMDQLIVWNPHSSQIRGFYGRSPAVMLEPLTFFFSVFEEFHGRDDVIAVSPDAGAAKLVTHFSRAMNIQSAVASKFRPKPENVEVSEVIGEFRGKKTALILDDMISSGGTVHAVARVLSEKKGVDEIYLAASHNLCSDAAYEKMRDMHENHNLKRLYVTDTVPQQKRFTDLPYCEVYSIAEDLALTINRMHFNRSVSEVFYNPPE